MLVCALAQEFIPSLVLLGLFLGGMIRGLILPIV
jgi:hypothetical protein